MRRVAIAAVLCAIGLIAPAAQADTAVKLSPTGGTRFPERSYLVTLPERTRLAPESVYVTENGRPVHDLRVAPVGSQHRAKLGVVLAIDASRSMEGEAFAGALDAARAFARERNPRQPLAIVTFGNGSKVLLPFTTLDDEIESALSAPGTPSGGTDMYDAALRSTQLVRQAGLRGGFVVVLSDGTDHGSSAGNDEVVAAAQAAHVRVYTVGLQSPAFDPAALTTLAGTAGGEYSEATSAAELQDIYRVLGAEISNAHVLRYGSLVRPGRKVTVRASIAGIGSATTSYRTPRLRFAEAPPAKPGENSGGWNSSIAIAALIGLVVILIAISLILVLRGRRHAPADRVADFVKSGDEEPEELTLTGRLAAGAERSFSTTSSWQRFAAALTIAAVDRGPGEVAILSALGALSVGFVVASASGSGALGALAILVVAGAEWAWIRKRMRRERRRFAAQLADHLSVVGGSLRVGHGLAGALGAALDEADEPTRREFGRAVTDERLGMPLEDALQGVAVRMENREVEHVALLAKLQREAGADAAEMVDQVVATVREREELRRLVRTLTAQGRLSQTILTLLPIGSVAFLTVSYPEYVDPLYHTAGGHLVLAVAALLLIAGALIIRRIVSFRV